MDGARARKDNLEVASRTSIPLVLTHSVLLATDSCNEQVPIVQH